MPKRNPAATCGNCPYGEIVTPEAVLCKVFPDYTWRATEHVCGQHPDFWEQAEITNTCPSCWPASDDERAPEWTHVGAQSTTYCPHCGKAMTSTFEQESPDNDARE